MKRLVAEAMDQGAIGGGNGGQFMSDLRCHARSAARLFGSGVDGPNVLAACGRIGVQADAERGRGAVARRAGTGIDQAADKSGFPAVGCDDARHQREPAGVDDPGRVLADLADRDDAAILDRAVGAHRVVPEPVDYCCSADHEVMLPPKPARKSSCFCNSASAPTQQANSRTLSRCS
jgi:hypothetical protein